MLEEADRATPDSVREHYADVYREMRAAGYTAVGEFHYLGAAEALAAADAAATAGIAIVLLHVAYERGGLDRMRQPSVAAYLEEVEALREAGIAVGVAPHSVRACSRAWLEEIGAYATREGLPLHIHADEQPREIQECLEEHGCRPIELWPTRAASASGRPSSTRRMRTMRSSISSPPRELASARALRPSPISATGFCA